MTPRGMAKFGYMILNRGRWGRNKLFLRIGSENQSKKMLPVIPDGNMDISDGWARASLMIKRLKHFGQPAMGAIIFSYFPNWKWLWFLLEVTTALF